MKSKFSIASKDFSFDLLNEKTHVTEDHVTETTGFAFNDAFKNPCLDDLNSHQNDLCSLSIKKYPILTTLGFPFQNQFFFRFLRNDFETKNEKILVQ